MPESSNTDIQLLNDAYRYAMSLCSNHADAEDLVHEAWLRLIKRYRRTPEKSLFYKTIRNIFIDQYRRSRKFPAVEFDETNSVELGDGADTSMSMVASDEMERLLDTLRDVEREALFLSVVDGYTAEEIAHMTGTSRGNVLSLIHRAKIKIRESDKGKDVIKHDRVVRLADRKKL